MEDQKKRASSLSHPSSNSKKPKQEQQGAKATTTSVLDTIVSHLRSVYEYLSVDEVGKLDDLAVCKTSPVALSVDEEFLTRDKRIALPAVASTPLERMRRFRIGLKVVRDAETFFERSNERTWCPSENGSFENKIRQELRELDGDYEAEGKQDSNVENVRQILRSKFHFRPYPDVLARDDLPEFFVHLIINDKTVIQGFLPSVQRPASITPYSENYQESIYFDLSKVGYETIEDATQDYSHAVTSDVGKHPPTYSLCIAAVHSDKTGEPKYGDLVFVGAGIMGIGHITHGKCWMVYHGSKRMHLKMRTYVYQSIKVL